ncbi:MAG: hypothetical protein MAG451_03075 [Anaerolineales bacterium]|nr:hypothetical protein [Anaerolineales bacterium]
MSTATAKKPASDLFEELSKGLPMIYEEGEPKAVVLDLHVFQTLLQRLDELEERELLNDPAIVEGLQKAREDHLAGRLTSHTDLIKELGLEGEL